MSIVSQEKLCRKPSSPSTGSCPHASSNKSLEGASLERASKAYTVSFEPLSVQNFFSKIISLVKEIGSRASPSSLKSAWYIGSQNDLSQPFLRSWKPGSYVSEFATPAGTVYVTADPAVMRAVFANSRKAETGIFYDYENKRLFVDGILRDLYSEDVQKIGLNKAVDITGIT